MGRASSSFSADVVGNDDTMSVVLLGELDMDSAPILERSLETLFGEGPDEIILDFSELAFIDSSGIATLISVQKRLIEQGRHVAVRSPKPIVVKVFEITDLMGYLNVQMNQKAE